MAGNCQYPGECAGYLLVDFTIFRYYNRTYKEDSVYEKKKIVSLPAVYVGSHTGDAGIHSGCICTRNG